MFLSEAISIACSWRAVIGGPITFNGEDKLPGIIRVFNCKVYPIIGDSILRRYVKTPLDQCVHDILLKRVDLCGRVRTLSAEVSAGALGVLDECARVTATLSRRSPPA